MTFNFAFLLSVRTRGYFLILSRPSFRMTWGGVPTQEGMGGEGHVALQLSGEHACHPCGLQAQAEACQRIRLLPQNRLSESARQIGRRAVPGLGAMEGCWTIGPFVVVFS